MVLEIKWFGTVKVPTQAGGRAGCPHSLQSGLRIEASKYLLRAFHFCFDISLIIYIEINII